MGWNGKKDAKGRRLLQIVGTEAGRKLISSTIWIKKWHEKVKTAVTSEHDVVIVPDMRFLNEINYVASFPYHRLILITGRSYDNVPSHASEQDFPAKSFDLVFVNNGSIKKLDKFAKDLVYYGSLY
jgi:hypothetical protein